MCMLMVIIETHLCAQITFEKAYRNLPDVEIAKTCDLTDDGGYVIGVGEKSVNSSARYDAIIKLNAYGDTEWYKPFIINSNNGNLQFVRNSKDGGYYAFGARTDTSGDHSLMLWIMKLDSLGNVKWSRNFTDILLDFKSEGNTLKIRPDGSLFMWLSKLYLLNYTSNGNFVNFKQIPYFNNNADFSFKNNLLLQDTNFYYLVLKSGGSTYRIMKSALNGDTITSIPIVADTGIFNLDLLKKTSTNYFTCAFAQPLIYGKHPFSITKLDSLGNKIWNKFYPFIAYSNQIPTIYLPLQNQNNIVCAIPNTNGFNAPTGKAVLFCFDNNGDSLWYKQLSPSDTSAKTEIFDVIATPDSGLLAVGQILLSNNQQKSYIVKLDANGNLFNPLSVIEKKKETYLHIYPNPANEYTNLHYMGIEKNVLLSISNIQGQVIYKQKIEAKDSRINLNTTVLPAGLYFCSINSASKAVVCKKLVVMH